MQFNEYYDVHEYDENSVEDIQFRTFCNNLIIQSTTENILLCTILIAVQA